MKYLLQRHYASSCLDIVKLKEFVPCDVENSLNGVKTRIARIVFNPSQIDEVNKEFQAAGYIIRKGMAVIAVNEDESILVWGGVNSVYHMRKREEVNGILDKLAFDDLLDLTQRFKIKNKKVEIDAMMALLKKTYGGTA